MQRLGDWLDRTVSFVGGFLGTFLGLAFALALIETFTPVRLELWGSRNAVAILMAASSFAVAIWSARRAGRASAPPSPEPAVRPPETRAGVADGAAVPERAVRTPTAEDRAMAEAMAAAMVAQVRRERELHDGTWPVPPSVRLVPQVPIRDQQAPRNWLGGRPRMPATLPWPEVDGTACDFLAQVALADLPADLWHGSGPREGWLALFIHPERYSGHLLHISELGPARDAPNPPAVPDGWYHPCGGHRNDAVEQRYLRRAFPEWPVDVIATPAGEISRRDDAGAGLCSTGFDLADPAHHPFDWAGMQALVDCAVERLEFRFAMVTSWPDQLGEQLAGLEACLAGGGTPANSGRPSEPDTPEQIAWMENRAAALRELIPAAAEARRLGLAAMTEVRQIATEIHEQAGRLPFTPLRAEALLTRLRAIRWMHVARRGDPQNRPGAELIETTVLPITVHHPDTDLFAGKYHVVHFDMARHAYCRDVASLPAATRAFYEPLWRRLGTKSASHLGGFPEGFVHDFSPEADVLVLHMPTSQLMGWMFGDVDDLVLMMTRDQLAASRFADARFDVTN